MTKTPSFVASSETEAILAALREVPIDSVLSYKQISRLTGGEFKVSSLYSAVNKARKEGLVFGTVRTVGVKRLSAVDTIDKQTSNFRSIRHKARKVQAEMASTLKANLSHRDQLKATQIHAAAGIVLHTAVIPVSNREKLPETNEIPLKALKVGVPEQRTKEA